MEILAYESHFLLALALTCLIETSVLLIYIKIFQGGLFKAHSMGCLLFAGILPSFATLPYAWFVLPFHDLPFPWRDALVEFSVIAMEGAILWSILKMKAFESFKLSFVCNAGSYLTGLLLYKYLRL